MNANCKYINAVFNFDIDTNCMERIFFGEGGECSYLEIELHNIIIDNKHHSQTDNGAKTLIDIIGLAAHESMYLLLSKYNLNNNG